MVSVTSRQPEAPSGEEWIESLAAGRPGADAELIRRAWRVAVGAHAGQTRASGEPYVTHSAAVARILADLRLDAETIAAAILHDVVEDTPVTLEDVKRDFGPRIAALVDGVTKMAAIREFRGADERSRDEHVQAESLRKMLLAMAEDVRVVLIKLADRLHNMRTLGALSEDSQRRIARETLELFAPLANRLGIWQVKWELEDLSLRYLDPATYKQIAALLAEKRVAREQYIERFVAQLSGELEKAHLQAEVTGRPKHIYGIWRKMKRKGKDFAQITDIRGVRVLVDSVRDCYAALGVVHTLWNHIPGEFDDYIATPKENNYRSIHTAVIGPEGKVVEVQIRTGDMHKESELGVAAHWRYKEGARADESFDQKIAWLRTLLAWKDEVAEAAEFVDQFKSEVFSERVYVFTPKGKIVDLQAGATPLDFAYHVHTEVGHRCRGAKVNGRMVPLTWKLKTGEQVEIITAKEGGPSRDWLSPHLGYLATSKARAKVAHWFREQGREAAVVAGRAELERELDRLGLTEANHELLAKQLHFASVEDFFAALGHGEVKPAQIAGALREYVEPAWKRAPAPAHAPAPAKGAPAGITVQGVGKILTRMARCCNPLPGEAIVGFITRGQGVTIHRADCPNALHHRDEHGERLVQVSWGAEAAGTYPVEVEIEAIERTGLLGDITGLLATEKINVVAVNTRTDKETHVARLSLTLEMPDLETLSRVLALIDRIPNVTRVRRRVQ
jgi:GTP pyrophosphokinase